MRCSPTAGTSSASSGSPARSRSASCRRTRACRRATTRCAPWAELPDGERRLFTRLQAAYAAMLDHADQHLARLMAFLETAGQLDDTLVLVMSDNGASQEGGPFGMVNAMGPYNLKREPIEEKIARIDDIGGPDTHSNFPLGWAMAANTPLRRYKQNTHGGGIRDPLVHGLAQGHRRARRAAPPVLPRQRPRADPARRRRHQAAQGDQRRQADADRGHQLRRQASRPAKAPSKTAAAVLRDVRPSRPGAGRLEGRGFHPPGNAFDHDKWELLPSRPRLQRDRRSRRAASPSG